MSALVHAITGQSAGGVLATDHASLTVEPGEIHAIIGPRRRQSTLIRPARGRDQRPTKAMC